MRNFRLKVLMLALLGTLVISCNKDDNGGDTPNNQPTEVEVTGITLDQTNIITNAGERIQLVVTITPDNATNKDIVWSSSDVDIVTITTNGKLMAETRGGTAVITAKLGDKTATCTVNVIPEGMTITNGEVTAMDKTKIPADGILGIPAIVSKIGDAVFKDCTELKGIHIPNSVTSIGEYAFRKCESLTSINIPNGVTSIEAQTFFGCVALTSINIPNSVTSIGGHAFRKCESLTSINIPNGVTSIGEYAFEECSSLTSIDIPNSVTDIGQITFRDCEALTSVKLPKELTNIKYGVFHGCISLTSIELPDSLTSIEGSAFKNCTALTSITIPANVTKIGDDSDFVQPTPGAVFNGCTALESIICMPTTPPTLFNNDSDVNDNFENTSASLKIKVPADKVDAYKATAGWSDVAAKIEAQ